MRRLLARLGINSREDFWRFLIQFIKFGLVGVTNTVVSLAVLYTMMWLGLSYIPAYILGFLAGVANSFALNSRFVFAADATGRAQRLVKILIANLLTLGIGTAALMLQVERLGIPEHIAVALNILITTPISFLLSKFWVFRK